LTHSFVFGIALGLSASGVFILVHFAGLPNLDQEPLFWFVAVWALAQALLIGTSVSSFRSARRQRQAEQQLQQVAQLQRSLLDSAGPMMIATDLNERILVFNPAAERMLGYRAEEILGKARAEELFPPGELRRVGRRLVESINRLGPVQATKDEVSGAVLQNYVQYVSSFPVSRVRGFEIQFQRKDGTTFPAMVYLSAVRNPEAVITGLLTISTDLSATKRAEHALRESEERYRDLFENSNEMIATLSPRGRYLYVNPAWQTHFGQTAESFENLISFESAFPPEVQAEAAGLFRRALNGEPVERASLRLQGRDNQGMEVEASLSCRQEEGRPVSVRCIFRDVTQQNRRERRLAMQLEVSQIVGESTASDEALPQLLEAVASSLGCDLATLWVVDEDQRFMYFRSSWASPGHPCTEFLRDSRSRVYSRGQGLPGFIWGLGSPLWMEDTREDGNFMRRHSALLDGLVTAWGVPVRVGNQVIAIVEFFSRQRQAEDHEIMTTAETVCASIGQFMARSAQDTRVRELNRQKEFILNSVADGIFGTDPDGNVVFVNPAAAEMLGAGAQDLVGRSVHAIVHEGQPDGCTEPCRTRRAFVSHEAATGQDVFYRMNGTSFPVEFSATPMFEHGLVMGSVLSFRDISQRYALDRMKDEFVSTVSHELRTPLTSIRGALGLLAAGLLGEVSEKAGNLLRIAVSNSDRLVRLINDILDLERMESGRAPLSFRRCALNELAQQAIDAMNPMAEAAQVRLTLDAGVTFVEADSDRLLQIMTNLLSNAIKFSSPDSLVRVRIQYVKDGVTLRVIDQGRGIPAEKLETIFDRFQQVDASDSRQKGGTGLGLAICRTIIQQHGGRIWAERNADQGSTFSVFLPSRVRPEALEAIDGLMVDLEPDEDTVLICEGDANTRAVLAQSLQQNGYKVVESESGEETIALARELKLGAILLDMSSPELDSWETLRMLKEDRSTANIPIAVLSILHSSERPKVADGADIWLQQPMEEDALLREMGRVVRGASANAHVLLVEDDEDLARVIVATIERAGIQAHHAPTRRNAIELCQTTHPDLIILDLALPDGDGFHVVDWLRQHKQLRKLPLIVYSAREVSEPERKQLRLGPTEFLTKAKVQPQDVEALVHAMLRRFRAPAIRPDEAVPGHS
jgi:PAS domain S-box-containing protein